MNKKFVIEIGDVLLITDVQKDFLPGGALPVESGNEIIPVLNEYIRNFYAAKAHVLAPEIGIQLTMFRLTLKVVHGPHTV